MAIVDQIGNILKQYQGDATPDREQARAHYDEIANAVPQDELAAAIGPAVGQLDTPHVERKIEQSAQEMTPTQRGSFLGTLLGGLGASGSSLPGLLGSLGASPNVATDPTQATPQDVARVATYAKETSRTSSTRRWAFMPSTRRWSKFSERWRLPRSPETSRRAAGAPGSSRLAAESDKKRERPCGRSFFSVTEKRPLEAAPAR